MGSTAHLYPLPPSGRVAAHPLDFFALTKRRLDRIGTGNVSVSAAFYHGGQWVGILAVLSETVKGIAAVLLARFFFPTDPEWEIIALIALVLGRYWIGKGAGTTNVVWGYIVHDWLTAGLVFLIGGISFTLLRERRSGKLSVLILLPLITALRHPVSGELIGVTILLSFLMAWIYQKIPDDLELATANAQTSSRKMFRFFQGDRAIPKLDKPLNANLFGQKAATLSHLKRWGYPVPIGWVLPPGDDSTPLIESLQPSPDVPLIVRSSAIGEDSETASAAGQYESILNITSQVALERAILQCQVSYNFPAATRYRQDRGIAEAGMAVLVQVQVKGVFSGVAFSRDPISRHGDAVVIEALPGMATQVVSGQITPEQYRVWIREENLQLDAKHDSWMLPETVKLEMTGTGALPPSLIQQVAYLARHLEARYHGIPQDIEWSYDGEQLWVLQSRPITTLLPIWTRKIAAEVIPGFIRPLTWSINRPLTCREWGEIFTIVLGDRANGLNFDETATLHNSAAYFNASLLGEIFRRMGLPPESLEFLTRGTTFSKPSLRSTLRNLPGLLRLVDRELRLSIDFNQAMHDCFHPVFDDLSRHLPDQLPDGAVLRRIYQILRALKRATYFSIMVPLSTALRQALFRAKQEELDSSQLPEVASLRSLQLLAASAGQQIPNLDQLPRCSDMVFTALALNREGQAILNQFDQFLEMYGYLSDVATDIAVPTWRENPSLVRDLFAQYVFNLPMEAKPTPRKPRNWKTRLVQRRLNLKGRVTEIYSRLLAQLRWSFVTLEQRWIAHHLLSEPGDIFFLTFDEIEKLVTDADPTLPERVPQLITERRSRFEQDSQVSPPMLVYGNEPPIVRDVDRAMFDRPSAQQLQGIGASPGQVEGQVVIVMNLQSIPEIDRHTILVVPYTDSGWSPLLAQAGGLIAEVGGQLSHGAIVAREYGIPAVMNIIEATQRFQNGQRVRMDGQTGIVEILI